MFLRKAEPSGLWYVIMALPIHKKSPVLKFTEETNIVNKKQIYNDARVQHHIIKQFMSKGVLYVCFSEFNVT